MGEPPDFVGLREHLVELSFPGEKSIEFLNDGDESNPQFLADGSIPTNSNVGMESAIGTLPVKNCFMMLIKGRHFYRSGMAVSNSNRKIL